MCCTSLLDFYTNKTTTMMCFFSFLITKQEIFKSKHSPSQASTGVWAKSHNLTLNFMACPLTVETPGLRAIALPQQCRFHLNENLCTKRASK